MHQHRDDRAGGNPDEEGRDQGCRPEHQDDATREQQPDSPGQGKLVQIDLVGGQPLQGVYAAVFIDAIYVMVRDGQVGSPDGQ